MYSGKFKVGDKVLITRASTEEEYNLWGDGWISDMDKYIGSFCVIEAVYEEDNTAYLSNAGDWAYPIFVLKNANEDKSGQMLFDFMYEEN
jgi:hypothetical protein